MFFFSRYLWYLLICLDVSIYTLIIHKESKIRTWFLICHKVRESHLSNLYEEIVIPCFWYFLHILNFIILGLFRRDLQHFLSVHSKLYFQWFFECQWSFCRILTADKDSFRSSRSQMFFKIGVFQNFAIFTGKDLCQRLWRVWRSATLLKKSSIKSVFL